MKKLQLEQLGRVTPEEYKEQKKITVVVILDDIRSGMNVGSIFRSCDAFAIEKLFLCGITPKPPHKEIHKTAIGATMSVDWEYAKSSKDCILKLKQEGYKILAIEQTDESVFLSEFHFSKNEKYGLILGNEVVGVSDKILPYLDSAVEVKQFGTKHSLNVSVCCGVVLWKASHDLLG